MKEQEMWLARDENENLYLHDTKPKKGHKEGYMDKFRVISLILYFQTNSPKFNGQMKSRPRLNLKS